ncbi:DDE Tnp4 domain-containing protein [Mycena venus]|uniref:DDE Tnp4 domain-containing protein n=1 Tax=Mycena venus TaxID=2733690 RepID=A0A8H6Y271_9AGAR|nr:DDE Tnp4 domain-containing protein [Mycena venus]
MPRLSARQRRVRDVLKTFLEHHAARMKGLLRRKKQSARHFARAGLTPQDSELLTAMESPPNVEISINMTSDSESDSSSSSSVSSDLSSDSSTSSSDFWSDILGSDWRGSSSSSSASSTESGSLFGTNSDDSMPELHPFGYPDSDEEDDSTSDSDSTSTTSSGDDGDDEGWSELDDMEIDEGKEFPSPRRNNAARWVRQNLEEMYAHRYEMPRDTFPRGPAFLRHVLGVLKDTRADLFRQELRVSPLTFDKLVNKLADHPVFANNSTNGQMPVEDQMLVQRAVINSGFASHLCWMFAAPLPERSPQSLHLGSFKWYENGGLHAATGHYLGSGLQKVANWAGVGKGTITVVTRRVMTAILDPGFMTEAVRMPTPSEKEKAKAWIEAHSCRAWRDGWCMVDGTLVALFDRPFWFGESYFDRKCNYSLNIQIVSLPNLRIIDFGYGYTGSTHDSTAWEGARLAKERETLLQNGEFIWADSAYTLEKWMISPFKKPFSLLQGNEEFNNHVSMVRIRSEHAIGFFKGRFQSMKGLRVNIKDEKTHKFATYWIAACIGIHSFAMQCEAEERGADGDDEAVMADPFIDEGLSSSDSEVNTTFMATGIPVHAGKAKREELKRRLFKAKERRKRHRARRQRQELGLDSDGSVE